MSLVDVSVSMLTQFNVPSTTSRKRASSSPPGTSASVTTTAIIVAMSGSIIPAPLATPTILASLPATTCSAIFGRVSVVIIAAAARSIAGSGSCAGTAATPSSIRSIG